MTKLFRRKMHKIWGARSVFAVHFLELLGDEMNITPLHVDLVHLFHTGTKAQHHHLLSPSISAPSLHLVTPSADLRIL